MPFLVSKRNSRALLLAVAAVAGLAVARPAFAATTDGAPDSQYTALSAQSVYAASGYVTINTGGSSFNVGSGTLIAPDWVLTAASIVSNNAVAFGASEIDFGQRSTVSLPGPSSIARVILDPAWSSNLFAGNDLALIQLSTPITSIAPATLYASSLGSEVGQTATVVGYGQTGTGLTGQAPNTAGTRRAIQNVVDAIGGAATTGGSGQPYSFTGVSTDIMLTDFDQPETPSVSLMGASTPLTLEGASAQGDGGGGLFFTSGAQTYLAGVTSVAGAFPNNPYSTQPDGHYGDYDIYTRIAVADTLNFLTTNLATASTYLPGGGNSWAGPARWSNTLIPEFAGATANFTTATSASTTVSLNTNWTVGSVTFNNVNSYTIAPGTAGTLTLDNGTNTSAITDAGGSHSISAPVVLNSNSQLSVSHAGDLLTISGNISGAGAITVAAGSVTFSASNTYSGGTTVNAGAALVISPTGSLPSGKPVIDNGLLSILAGTKATPVILGNSGGSGDLTGSGVLSVGKAGTAAYVQLASIGATTSVNASVSTLSSLTIGSGSTLDITNNVLQINYASGADPLQTIRGYLQSAYSKGNWQNAGLTSTTVQAQVAANKGTTNGIWSMGYADGNDDGHTVAAAGQLIVEPVLAADANFDGKVDFNDLLLLAQNVGSATGDWMHADFNYDSLVDFNDLLILAQNINKTNGSTPLGGELPASFEAQWSLALAEVKAAGGAGSVPEPGAMSLLCAGALGLLARRRRRAASEKVRR